VRRPARGRFASRRENARAVEAGEGFSARSAARDYVEAVRPFSAELAAGFAASPLAVSAAA
jgi:hypothetical protein